MQPAGADPIGASLVFLHLLKGQSDRLAEFFLAQAEHVAAEPDARADMDIDRVWLVALSATRPSGLLLHRHRSIALAQKQQERFDRARDRSRSTRVLTGGYEAQACLLHPDDDWVRQRSRNATGRAPRISSARKIQSPPRA